MMAAQIAGKRPLPPRLRWGQDRVWWETFAEELKADCWIVHVRHDGDEYTVLLVVGQVRVTFSTYLYVDRLAVDLQVGAMATSLGFGPMEWHDPERLVRGCRPTDAMLVCPPPAAAASRFRELYVNDFVDLSTAVDRLVQAASTERDEPAFTDGEA